MSGGGEVTVVCSAQHFAVLLLACYPSIMNEVLRNDRSRSFFWSVFAGRFSLFICAGRYTRAAFL